jgi:hypothetical protein
VHCYIQNTDWNCRVDTLEKITYAISNAYTTGWYSQQNNIGKPVIMFNNFVGNAFKGAINLA